MDKLYRVEIVAFVMAEDENAALFEGHHADPLACDTTVTLARDVPHQWLAAYPFGGDGETTCGDYLKQHVQGF